MKALISAAVFLFALAAIAGWDAQQQSRETAVIAQQTELSRLETNALKLRNTGAHDAQLIPIRQTH